MTSKKYLNTIENLDEIDKYTHTYKWLKWNLNGIYKFKQIIISNEIK